DGLATGLSDAALAVSLDLCARCTPPLEQHAGDQRAGHDLEIWPMSRGIQIRRHSGLAPPAADRRLPRTESFGIAAIEIGAARQAEGIGGRGEAPDQRVGFGGIDDVE